MSASINQDEAVVWWLERETDYKTIKDNEHITTVDQLGNSQCEEKRINTSVYGVWLVWNVGFAGNTSGNIHDMCVRLRMFVYIKS